MTHRLSPPAAYTLSHVVAGTLLLGLTAWLAQHSGLDMAIARALYDPRSGQFPLRHAALLEFAGHRLLLALPVGVALLALAGALASYRYARWRPARGALWAIVLTCLVGQLAVGQLKHHTAMPRPYNLLEFGGDTAWPAHWWALSRAAAGNALPSAHAGAGYALLSLYFAGRALGKARWRWWGLGLGAAAGLAFSLVRILQGAHFLSQTLWSAAVMWLVASLVFCPLLARRRAAAGARARPA
ncbi:phosphatase PAP2 family protein [Bordetella petrii]|uniref:phosphatase PAP2 family protein n=1 Tax=Bordetella petrii TaxID=94624 RepID=UPI001A963046|nr:phosphatase PAP2 family protein [Bordetella petrii]MBO1113796.1 phosphatase PAP2 family protein [Bordetella petrii]